jgi:signal transduction histidine kinase
VTPYGLDQVPELVARARTSGLDATLTVQGRRPEVPAAVDRTAYRIVQESLTNIARHAAAATASVRIDYGADVLAISVDDDGRAGPDTAPTPGVGLLGMRERVTALGGRLRAGPRSGGGFSVHAELPVEQTS